MDKDEITTILREALQKKRDDALRSMSNKDQRLVSIATRPSEEQVQTQLQAVRGRALKWPFGQAMLSCAALFAVFTLGLIYSLSGSSLPQSVYYSSLLFFALTHLSLVQMVWQARCQ